MSLKCNILYLSILTDLLFSFVKSRFLNMSHGSVTTFWDLARPKLFPILSDLYYIYVCDLYSTHFEDWMENCGNCRWNKKAVKTVFCLTLELCCNIMLNLPCVNVESMTCIVGDESVYMCIKCAYLKVCVYLGYCSFCTNCLGALKLPLCLYLIDVYVDWII